MTGLYVLASAGLVCVSFLAGRRFPVVPRRDVAPGEAAEVAVPRLTGPVAAPTDGVSADAFAALDRRVTALERSARRRARAPQRADRGERVPAAGLFAGDEDALLDKPRTLSHYEALADQVARERQADEPRGRVMKFPSRPLVVAREHQDR